MAAKNGGTHYIAVVASGCENGYHIKQQFTKQPQPSKKRSSIEPQANIIKSAIKRSARFASSRLHISAHRLVSYTQPGYNFTSSLRHFSPPSFFKNSLMIARLRWLVTAVAVALNLFVYFYPDLVNSPGQCLWKGEIVESKYPLLNEYLPLDNVYLQALLLNFPSLRAPRNNATHNNDKVADIHMLTFGDPQINGNWASTKYIKRLDNYGNDYYLGHIYKIMKARLEPSHVAVMGDQFSSQWILDSEFYNRTLRFVERLFPRDDDYKSTVVETWEKHENYDWQAWLERERNMDLGVRFNLRKYDDVYDWVHPNQKELNLQNPLFINLTGNHDIGYSGDATWQHMARFHHLFGQDNYVITYNKGEPEEWRLVVLGSLTLEGPALEEDFLKFTWSFLEHLNETNKDFKGSTVLLTHIPFYKEEGICVDGPEHRYYENYEKEPYKNGKLRSQNHLLHETSQKVLNIVFPNTDKEGLILTGHDHEGCSSYYNLVDGEWVASKEPILDGAAQPIHEVVVRAMMGEYDGQTGLVTGQFDYDRQEWKFDFKYCSFVVQHWWWASRVAALVALLVHLIAFLTK